MVATTITTTATGQWLQQFIPITGIPIIYKFKKIPNDNLSTRSYRREQERRYCFAAKSIIFSHNSNVKYNLSLGMHSWHFLPSFNIKQHSLRMQWRLTTCPAHCNLNGPSGARRHLAPTKSIVRMAEEKTDVHRKTGFNLCNCNHCKMHLQPFTDNSTSS